MTDAQLLASRVVPKHTQVACPLGDETMILSLENGVYYGLDPVGSRIWELLNESGSVAQIREALVEEFDVDPERCERDVLALIRQLLHERLVDVSVVAP
jgi:hypothetical protein